MGVIMHNNIPYGGGSTIEPNPQESATEQLETLGIDGDVYEVTDANAAREVQETITEAQSRANLADGDSVPTIFGKIKKFFSDLKTVAFTGAYSDLSGTPTIPTVNNGTLTIKQNNTNLGTFTANQSTASNINIECAVPSDVEGSKVATGNPITITDAAGIKAEKIEIGFEPKQDLHGYDKPWVGGAGKNKLPTTVAGIKAVNTDGTWNGNVYTINNATFTIETDNDGNVTGIDGNGTPNNGTAFNLTSNFTTSADCILTGSPQGSADDKYFIQLYPVNIREYGISANVPSGTTSYALIYVRSGIAMSHVKFYPMLRLSTVSDYTFAPYSNKASITGYTSISANRCGKNLWGGSQMKSDILSKIATATSPSTNEVSFYPNSAVQTVRVLEGVEGKPFKENTQYTFIVKSKNTSVVSYAGQQIVTTNLGFFYTDGTNEIIYHIGNSANTYYTSAIKSNASKTLSYIRVIYQSGDCTFDVTNCGIFEGNVATSAFEAYNGRNVTVQFGKTIYGGKLTILQDGSAEVYCDTGFGEFDGSSDENWTLVDNNSIKTDYIFPAMKTATSTWIYAFSSDFSAGADGVAPSTWLTTYATNNPTALEFRNIVSNWGISAYTVDAWKSYLASRSIPLQVAYELKDPFTIHLSPVETLDLLQGINNVWTDGTTLSLTYQPDNAIGQAKGTAQAVGEKLNESLVGNYSPNLFDINNEPMMFNIYGGKIETSTTHGSVSVDSNGIKSTNRTSSTAIGVLLGYLNAGTYTVSVGDKNATMYVNTTGQTYPANGLSITDIASSETNSVTFTISEAKYVCLGLYINSNIQIYCTDIQLEKGIKQTYYQNFIPTNADLAKLAVKVIAKKGQYEMGVRDWVDMPDCSLSLDKGTYVMIGWLSCNSDMLYYNGNYYRYGCAICDSSNNRLVCNTFLPSTTTEIVYGGTISTFYYEKITSDATVRKLKGYMPYTVSGSKIAYGGIVAIQIA